MRKLFRKGDLIIIFAIILLSGILLIPKLINNDYLTALIYVDGIVEYEIDLNAVKEDYSINPDSSPHTEISVQKGRICFSSAECKDKLCVNCGWLTSNGQTAACLPAKVVISIKSNNNSLDAVTY